MCYELVQNVTLYRKQLTLLNAVSMYMAQITVYSIRALVVSYCLVQRPY